MIRGALFLMAFATSLPSARVLAAEAPFQAVPSGRIEKMAWPDYPADALAKRQSGHVDVTGEVTFDGRLSSIRMQPDSPASSILVEAVETVVKRWVYTMPLGSDCMPSPEPVSTRVLFEIDENGKSRVGVKPGLARRPAEEAARAFTPVTIVKPEYPFYMVKGYVQARVFSRIEVDSSGTVADVQSKAVTTWKPRRISDHPWFEEAANVAIRQWRFPADAAPTRVVCREIKFNLVN